jgi:AraC family transcriptional regulator
MSPKRAYARAPSKAFFPRMEAQTSNLHTMQPLSFRRLPGAIADVWHVQGEAGGGGYYIAPDPRLVIFLGEMPRMALSTDPELTTIQAHQNSAQAMFIPAGVPLWSRLETSQRLSHIDFHLEAAGLHNRLSGAGLGTVPDQARFLTGGAQLNELARLAADEVERPRRGEMLIDGLLTALLGEVFATAPEHARNGDLDISKGGLSPHLLGAVKAHVHANLARHVGVTELAETAGLSESWFGRAFKLSVGETPQRWQARIRLEAARDLMRDPDLALAEIADATGFADQAHLSRAFRVRFGQPPSAWRREQGPQDAILRQNQTNRGGAVQDSGEYPS